MIEQRDDVAHDDSRLLAIRGDYHQDAAFTRTKEGSIVSKASQEHGDKCHNERLAPTSAND
jgi:hypothetical protein